MKTTKTLAPFLTASREITFVDADWIAKHGSAFDAVLAADGVWCHSCDLKTYEDGSRGAVGFAIFATFDPNKWFAVIDAASGEMLGAADCDTCKAIAEFASDVDQTSIPVVMQVKSMDQEILARFRRWCFDRGIVAEGFTTETRWG